MAKANSDKVIKILMKDKLPPLQNLKLLALQKLRKRRKQLKKQKSALLVDSRRLKAIYPSINLITLVVKI